MTKPFVREAANGFRSYYAADELTQEPRVYQNPAATLVIQLFSKGILTAQDVLDALGLNDTFDVNSGYVDAEAPTFISAQRLKYEGLL